MVVVVVMVGFQPLGRLNKRTKGWFLARLSALDERGVLFKSTVCLDWQGFQTSSVRHQASTVVDVIIIS